MNDDNKNPTVIEQSLIRKPDGTFVIVSTIEWSRDPAYDLLVLFNGPPPAKFQTAVFNCNESGKLNLYQIEHPVSELNTDADGGEHAIVCQEHGTRVGEAVIDEAWFTDELAAREAVATDLD